MSRDRSFITNEHTGKPDVAKTTPIEFFNQVKTETKKVEAKKADAKP